MIPEQEGSPLSKLPKLMRPMLKKLTLTLATNSRYGSLAMATMPWLMAPDDHSIFFDF